MFTYAVSFTIHSDSDHSRRYTSLMSEIRKSGKVWAETTSFCLVETIEQIADFERRLYLTDFLPSRDRLLVLNVQDDVAIARGDIQYPSLLRSLVPRVQVK